MVSTLLPEIRDTLCNILVTLYSIFRKIKFGIFANFIMDTCLFTSRDVR